MQQQQKFVKVVECDDRTYDHYTQMVKTAREQGYEMCGFGGIDKLRAAKKAIIARHDIDFSPRHALKLAALEYVLDLSATYFVSLHRPHYSPLTSEMRKTIHTLIELGHDLGLHYEAEFDNLVAEIAMLEHYLDCKIVAIARHNPFGHHFDIDKQSKPKNVVDAYSDEIMQEFKYISDSSGIWREGCWHGHIGKRDKLQVLTHPEWWDSETVDPVEQLRKINTVWTTEHNQQAQLWLCLLLLQCAPADPG